MSGTFDRHEELEILLAELQINYKELSDRRETEYKLLGSLVLFYPVLYYGFVTLLPALKDVSYLAELTGVTISICIFLVTLFVVIKIKKEHRMYEIVGRTIVNITKKLDLISSTDPEDGILPVTERYIYPKVFEKFGSGPGYLTTTRIIWVLGLSTIVAFLLPILGHLGQYFHL